MNYRECLRTESPIDNEIIERINYRESELADALFDIQIAASVLDRLKKEMFYKKGNTVPEGFEPVNFHTNLSKHARLLHGLIGIIGEAGELAAALYDVHCGQELDKVNVKEEVGDSRWYQELVLDELGTTMEEVEFTNLAKLMARYGNSFSLEKAENRNLEVERKILES